MVNVIKHILHSVNYVGADFEKSAKPQNLLTFLQEEEQEQKSGNKFQISMSQVKAV